MEDGNEQAMKDFLKQQKVGPAKKSSQSGSYLVHDMGISASLFFLVPFLSPLPQFIHLLLWIILFHGKWVLLAVGHIHVAHFAFLLRPNWMA